MPTPSQSPSVVEANIDPNEILRPKYTPAEEQYLKTTMTRLCQMRDEREKPRPQFNGMTYSQWDDTNIKADLSYIPPAKNRGDTRIVTGMTRDKDSTLLSTCLSYDFEPNIAAYDLSDMMIDEIGEEMEDLVRKSRQMEDYDSKRPLLYRGIIARGTYYAMEMYTERYEYEKDLPVNYIPGTVTGASWGEKIKKSYSGCEVIALDPKKVFLGDMSIFNIQDQDAVAIIDVISRDMARSLYQDWERWKFVPKKISPMAVSTTYSSSLFDQNHTITEVNQDQVERILIMKKFTNEMQIYLNCTQMLPVVELGTDKEGNPIVSGFPLTSVSPSGNYPIAKGDFEPVDGFAISKGQPAKMSTDQNVQDELLKLMILKTKKSNDPPMGNNSGRVLTSRNFQPAVITDDIREGSVYPLMEAPGVTAAEFSFYELIKGMMEEKSVSRGYEGSENRDMTATQVLENKKQQILKLGLSLDGIIRFERDLAALRTPNILMHWTKLQDTKIDSVKKSVQEIYRTFSVDRSKYGKRQRSRKIIKFTTDVAKMKEEDPEGDVIHEQELKAKKDTGVEEVYSYINPIVLKNLKARWYVTIVPNDKKDDTLSRMIFVQNIREAKELFGPNSTQEEKLKQRFAAVIGEDFDTWFRDEASLQDILQQQQVQAGGGMKTPVNPGVNGKPSMKTVLQS